RELAVDLVDAHTPESLAHGGRETCGCCSQHRRIVTEREHTLTTPLNEQGESAVDERHERARLAPGSVAAVLVGRPRQRSAVRIRWVGRGERHASQGRGGIRVEREGAHSIHGRARRELCGTETGNNVAAAYSAALLESTQQPVHV